MCVLCPRHNHSPACQNSHKGLDSEAPRRRQRLANTRSTRLQLEKIAKSRGGDPEPSLRRRWEDLVLSRGVDTIPTPSWFPHNPLYPLHMQHHTSGNSHRCVAHGFHKHPPVSSIYPQVWGPTAYAKQVRATSPMSPTDLFRVHRPRMPPVAHARLSPGPVCGIYLCVIGDAPPTEGTPRK